MYETGFVVPTRAALVSRIRGDVNAALGGQDAFLPRTLAWVMSGALAGLAWTLYQALAWVVRQALPDTADLGIVQAWANRYDLTWLRATKAAGTVRVTGTLGATFDDGAFLTRPDGWQYVVTGGPYVWAAPGAKDVTIESYTAGADGNYAYAVGASLTITSPPAGITAAAPLKTSVDIDGGTDDETRDALLARLLLRLQTPPQGGSKSDYEQWTLATPTVSAQKVWVFDWLTGAASGAVEVYFIVTDTGSGVIPGGADVAAVQAYLVDTARRPMTAHVTAHAPTPHAVDITIADLTIDAGSDLAVVKSLIADEIKALFLSRAEVSLTSTAVPNSWFHEAINAAAGVNHYEIHAIDGGSGTDDLNLSSGEFPILGTITWS